MLHQNKIVAFDYEGNPGLSLRAILNGFPKIRTWLTVPFSKSGNVVLDDFDIAVLTNWIKAVRSSYAAASGNGPTYWAYDENERGVALKEDEDFKFLFRCDECEDILLELTATNKSITFVLGLSDTFVISAECFDSLEEFVTYKEAVKEAIFSEINETYIFYKTDEDHNAISVDAICEVFRNNFKELFIQNNGEYNDIWFRLGISRAQACTLVNKLNGDYYNGNFFVDPNEKNDATVK